MCKLLVTCEHASNRVPDVLAAKLAGRSTLLRSHRALDRGALEAAERIASVTGSPIVAGTCTRLAIDLNRGERNPYRFSSWSRALGTDGMKALEERWYRPFRKKILEHVTSIVEGDCRVIHLSIHTFIPVLKGVRRSADVGLLYDPSRNREREMAAEMKKRINAIVPAFKVRYNYPYRGVSDGTARWLRSQFTSKRYSGMEIEINQRLLGKPNRWKQCLDALAYSVRDLFVEG